MNEVSQNTQAYILEQYGHNTTLLPDELVALDFMSDSLLHKPLPPRTIAVGEPRSTRDQLTSSLAKLFGFPHVIPVSQGRLAEAILFKVLSRNGTFIPSNGLFPTTQLHAQLGGATVVEVLSSKALTTNSDDPFKGNIDLDKLEATIKQSHPRWVSCIAIEPCNNAIGGHPISLQNLKQVREIASSYQIPVYLDACRIIENALLIAEREQDSREIWEIVRDLCACADFCSFSASKDLAISSGGFLATRNEAAYHEFLDISLLLGGGLSHFGMSQFLDILEQPQDIIAGVRRKMSLVQHLHGALASHCPLLSPIAGHAIYLDTKSCEFALPKTSFPVRSFLHHLFRKYGVRGSENPACQSQLAIGQSLIRFAVPVTHSEEVVQRAAESIRNAYDEKELIRGLKKTGQPPGFSGAMRASFSPI